MPRTEPPITSFPWRVHGYCRNPDCDARWASRQIEGNEDFKRSQFKCEGCGRKLTRVRFEAMGLDIRPRGLDAPLLPMALWVPAEDTTPAPVVTLVTRGRNGRVKRTKLEGQYDLANPRLTPLEYGHRLLLEKLSDLGKSYYNAKANGQRWFSAEEGTRYQISSDPESPFYRYVELTVWPAIEQAITEKHGTDYWQRWRFPPLGEIIDRYHTRVIDWSEYYITIEQDDGTIIHLGNEAVVTSPGQTIQVEVKVNPDV